VERNDQTLCRKTLVIVALCATLVVVATFPMVVLVSRYDRFMRDLDNRVGIHDVGLTELSRDRDAILARLEDVKESMRQQVDSLRALSARVDTCRREE
jgi:hypothetical protein